MMENKSEDENMSIDETFGNTSAQDNLQSMAVDPFSPMISRLKLDSKGSATNVSKNIDLNVNSSRNTIISKAVEDTTIFTDHTFNSIFSNETGEFIMPLLKFF